MTGTDTDTELFDLGLRLLDRQLVGSQDELLGNVDNLLLETVDGRLAVTALVCGPVGLAARFGGRTEVWMRSIWRRLRPERDPKPLVIPMTHVVSIEAAVRLDEPAQELVAAAAQLERWLRRFVIGRIPGATGGPDRLAGEPISPADPHAPERVEIDRDARLLSDLLGATVVDTEGVPLGTVLDVCSEPPHRGRSRVGALPLSAVVYGRHRLGSEMGYTTRSDQGPAVVAAPLQAWHRADRIVPADDVRIDWADKSVAVLHDTRVRHPHQRRRPTG